MTLIVLGYVHLEQVTTSMLVFCWYVKKNHDMISFVYPIIFNISKKDLTFVLLGQMLHFDELSYSKNIWELLANGMGTKCLNNSCDDRTKR